MSQTLRWGILGTGRIAEKFATQLPASEDGQLLAVGSRDPSRQPYWCTVTVMTYAAVVDHPDIDAIYIALPNGLHKEWTLRGLHAHKHVLCEKPLACSPGDVAAMFAAARSHQRVLIEAFMYRCQPAVQDALRLIHEGAIGEVRTLRGAFSFEHRMQPHDPRWDVEQGGGALLDVGCYPVQLMNAILGDEPVRVASSLVEAYPGVDSSGVALLHYPNGAAGVITFGMEIGGDRSFQACGTRGSIRFADPWLNGNEFVWQHDHGTENHTRQADKGLYALEADAFAAAVRGELEPWISEAESLRSARTLAAVRGAAR